MLSPFYWFHFSQRNLDTFLSSLAKITSENTLSNIGAKKQTMLTAFGISLLQS